MAARTAAMASPAPASPKVCSLHLPASSLHNSSSSLSRHGLGEASIADLVRQGELRHALSLYLRSRAREGFLASLRPSTFVSLIKACSKLRDPDLGARIHRDLSDRGLLLASKANASSSSSSSSSAAIIATALIDMHAKCGSLAEAREAFDRLGARDVVAWTSLLSGYAERGYGEDALLLFRQMKGDGICPDPVSLLAALKACIVLREIADARGIHAEIVAKGFEADPFLASALVDMYSKCGSIEEARHVFDAAPARDVVTWTALMAGYVEHGHWRAAMETFDEMKLDGFSPGAVAFVCIGKACGSSGCLPDCREIHHEASVRGHETNPVIGCTFVDMYAKLGSLLEAQEVFDRLPSRDVVPWTALISGYAESGYGERALACFEHMKLEGISPDPTIYRSCLKACSGIGAAAEAGYEIHLELGKTGWENELFSSSSLVDMYAKCGLLEEAEAIFGKLPVRDVVSWTALISGYALLGESEHVFGTIDRMLEAGTKPDHITLMSILNACSQVGLVDQSRLYFETLSSSYGLSPAIEHYNCIVDLLCRSGHIEEAVAMIEKMPFHPGIVAWHSVLGACRTWGNVELARYAFERATQLEENDASVYVCMCNIYVDASMEEEAKEVEAMRARIENRGY